MSNPNVELSKAAKSLSLSTRIYSDTLSKLLQSAAACSAVPPALTKRIELDRRLFGSTNALLEQLCQSKIISTDVQALASANRSLARMAERISIPDSALSKVFRDQQRLHATIKRLAINDSLTALVARIDATRMFSASLLAQTKLAGFGHLAFGRLAGIDTASSKALAMNFGNLTRSYQSLLVATSTRESLFRHAPFITTHVPVEYYREVKILESITVEDEDVEEGVELAISGSIGQFLPSVDTLLANLNDNLCHLLQGARDSVLSDNPDRARHVTTSVRELFTQVLHALAPDDELRRWSTNEEDFNDNRPTRRARLLYICRHINSEP